MPFALNMLRNSNVCVYVPTMKATILCATLLLAAAGAALADPMTKSIQQKLKDEGFFYGTVDGQSGEETVAALKRYQIRNGLPVTGQADLETTRALGVGGKPSYTESKGPAVVKDSYSGDRSPSPSQPPAQSQGQSSYYSPPPQQSYQQPSYPPPQPSYQSGGSYGPPQYSPPQYGPPQPVVALAKVFVATPYETAPPELQQEILRRAQYILGRAGYYRGQVDGLPGNMTATAIGQFQRERRLANSYRLDMGTLAEMDLLPRRVPPPPNWRYRSVWN